MTLLSTGVLMARVAKMRRTIEYSFRDVAID